ncbi:MAG: transglutaminase domain-containing protein [Bacteroidota bacterium]
MKSTIVTVALFFFSLNLNAQIDSITNAVLHEAVQRIPTTISDVSEIVNYFRLTTKDDQELLEMAFYWIALNIKYDLELSKKPQLTSSDISVERTLTTGKTICSGYSQLLCEFAYYLYLECEVISGIGQNYLEPSIDSLTTNHAWNAVEINNEWMLIDPTWGSGGYQGVSEDYLQQIDMRYFLADPKFLLIDHLPKNPEWQLVDEPISYSEFRNEYWSEMRFRKFNELMKEDDYQNHLRIMENAKRYENEN